MKKNARRGIVLLLAIVMTLNFSVLKPKAAAPGGGASGNKPTDVYIVLDNSRSMGKAADDGIGTDPQRLAIQCADAFFTTSPVGSAIGLITFAKETEVGPLIVNNGQSQKDTWDPLYTQDQYYTYITNALQEAGEGLNGEDAKNPNKAIILITDGANNGDDYEDILDENGDVIPIYCIFINGGKNEDEAKARTFLENVAQQSGTGSIYEINSADQINDTMQEIAKTIYYPDEENVTIGSTSIKPGEPFTKIITIPDQVYEFNCTINHDQDPTFALTITDPSGKVIYEKKDPKTKYITGTDNDSLTALKILLPEAGDYTFEMISEKEQEVKWTIIQMEATLDLKLDKGSVAAGEEVIASYSLKGNNPVTVVKGSIRIHNDAGDVIEDSALSGSNVTENADGTFTINTTDYAEGAYNVYAVCEVEDASGQHKQLASVFQSFNVGAAAASTAATTTNTATTEPEEPPKKKSIVPIIIGAAALIAAAAAAFILLKKRGSGTVYVSPAAGTLVIAVREAGQLISTIPVQLPMGLYGGKPKNLYEILKQETEWKNGDVTRIPQETGAYFLSCTGEKNGPENLQQINITDNEKRLLMQIPYNGTANFEAAEGVQVQFRWTTLRKRG